MYISENDKVWQVPVNQQTLNRKQKETLSEPTVNVE